MRTAGLLLVASLALVACRGGGERDDAEADRRPEQAGDTAETETGSANGSADESPACRLLTTDEVSDLFGHPAAVVPADRDVAVAGGSDSCLWQASADDDRSPTIYQLQLSVFTGNGAFDPRAWGEDPETVDGLGDEAFLVRAGALGTTAGYRAGDRSVFLSYAVPLGEDAPDSAAQADEVVALLRTVDTRLG
ncbi:MAG: hypothetical protein ACRD0V_12205 [Acidimicrobiales bacterium]